MEWTTDQLNALRSIEQWKIDCKKYGDNVTDEDRFYVLEGAAGTGKSTVVIEILKLFHGYKVCVAAPTHTAKEVISEMTGRLGLTVHTLLGLRPDLDLANYDPNNPTYTAQSREQIGDYDFIVIDCPPVMLVSDAIPIGNVVDGTVFVCSSQLTGRKDAKASIEILQKNNVNILGTVLTQVEQDGSSNGYYYYY